MSDTVLVIGATGKSGRRLVPLLAAKGVSVRAASRQPGEGRVVFDWDRPETHGPALAGVDGIYLITPDFVVDPSPAIGAFLDRARQAGIRRVVLVSSIAVNFPNEGPGSGRHNIEQRVMASGLEWTILRVGFISQNFSEGFLLPGILHGNVVASATGDGRVAFVDAEDIAAVGAATLTEAGHHGRIYDLTGPEAFTVAEGTEIVGRAAGRPLSYHHQSLEDFTAVLVGVGMPPDYAALVAGDQDGVRQGFGSGVSTAIADITGRPPKSFAAYAADAAEIWRQ